MFVIYIDANVNLKNSNGINFKNSILDLGLNIMYPCKWTRKGNVN